jgi:hypothetical protein
MYVGTTSGAIFRSTDGGKTWSGDMSSCILPRRLITRIAAHPADASTVVVTVASTGVPGTSLSNTPGSRVPYGHVFKSVNGGETWSPLDDNLPDAVYNAIAFQNSPPHALFVGGDCGVWVSADIDPTHVVSGGRWLSLAGNMPNVVVSDLIFHDKDRILTAATYGRGIWRLKLPEQFFMQQPDAKTDENVPFAAGLSRDDNFPGPDLVSPAAGAKLQNRSIHLSWTPVAGAIAYAIDVEQPQYTYSVSSVTTEVTFDYTPFGSGPPSSATWQVWAILPESRRSQASEKRPFTVMV